MADITEDDVLWRHHRMADDGNSSRTPLRVNNRTITRLGDWWANDPRPGKGFWVAEGTFDSRTGLPLAWDLMAVDPAGVVTTVVTRTDTLSEAIILAVDLSTGRWEKSSKES